ncbi:MAG: flagellar basal body-associated protein FliL [Alteromonadaceae bacterium]|nr:flagellar basal body-associated protein FliL [Alteromonadaceae bacterium]
MAAGKATDNELKLDDSSKKKKLIIMIAIGVVIIVGGIGRYLLLWEDDNTVPTPVLETNAGESYKETDTLTADATATVGMGSALYVPLPRPFRFNVPGSSRDRFVEIRVQLLVRGSGNEEHAKKHIPLIESTLLRMFTQSNADDLATSAGKASLKQKSLVEVQETMKDITGGKVVEQVLFTGFVMQ